MPRPATVLITLGLMVPTTVYVHLRFPGLRRLFDASTERYRHRRRRGPDPLESRPGGL